VLLKKGLAILVVLAVLVGLLWLAGVEGFWQAFAVGYGMWLFIDWYDCFFLDWVLFANMKAVDFPVRNTWKRPIIRSATTSSIHSGACSSD
jgi:hypothetical protein